MDILLRNSDEEYILSKLGNLIEIENPCYKFLDKDENRFYYYTKLREKLVNMFIVYIPFNMVKKAKKNGELLGVICYCEDGLYTWKYNDEDIGVNLDVFCSHDGSLGIISSRFQKVE